MSDIRLTPASANPNPTVRESVRAIIWDGSRVVLNREGLRVGGGEAWELPGGGIDPGESPEGAVLREAREETGLTCEIVRPAGILAGAAMVTNDWDEFRHHVYLLRPVSGTIGQGTEKTAAEAACGCEPHWLDLDEAQSLAFRTVPADSFWWQAHTLWGLDWLHEEIRAGRA